MDQTAATQLPSAKLLQLPPARAQQLPGDLQGWQLPTQVAASGIEEAGNGRFLHAPAAARQLVVKKSVVPWATVATLHALKPDHTIQFVSTQDLEGFVKAMQAASGFEEKGVVDVLENFVWSFDGTAAYLNWATWTINHDPSNARLRFEPVRGCEGISNNAESNCEADQVFMMGYATKDLEPGQELLMDYAAFSMPEFYSEFAKSRGFVHVRDKVVQP